MKNLFNILQEIGFARASQLASRLKLSQPSLSRLLQQDSRRIARFGAARSTEYALYESILGLAARQDLYWIAPSGERTSFAQLHHLADGKLYIEPSRGKGIKFEPRPGWALPWFLQPLLLQGYLGRQRSRELARAQPLLPSDLSQWSSTHHLFAHASGLVDGRGAVLVGDQANHTWSLTCQLDGVQESELPALYERLAIQAIGNGLPGTSSADGEQAKFILRVKRPDHAVECIVKFSPPRGTPFGERWHDLLWSEHVANQVLRDAGFEVANSRIMQTPHRTFLESERIDRIGKSGRRHMLALGVVHQQFVDGPFMGWSSTLKELSRQKKLENSVVESVQTLQAFGHLIGNSDMHSGNFSLIVPGPSEIWTGQFQLAPVYDMLSMHWAPRPHRNNDYDWHDMEGGLTALPAAAIDQARVMAKQFWTRLSDLPDIDPHLKSIGKKALQMRSM